MSPPPATPPPPPPPPTPPSLHFSPDFVLSSGTISLDPSKSLILLLYHPPTNQHLLPKGRKNVSETLHAAAERETWEESGFRCRLLEHGLPTNATQGMATPGLHREPIAVQQRMRGGVLKIIFWYVAVVDGGAGRDLGGWEEEGFEVRWVGREEAGARLSFGDDREIVERALCAVPGWV